MTHKTPDADRLERRARTAALAGGAYVRIAIADRVIRSSRQLIQQSAKLVSPSAFDSSARPLLIERRLEAATAKQEHQERVLVRELSEIGYSLRSYVEEVVLASQENRWKARQIRAQSGIQHERALRLQAAIKKIRRNAVPPPTLS